MNIKKFLPEKNKKTMIHIQVDVGLLEKANKKRKELDITWTELQEALVKAFLEEMENSNANE